MTEIKVGFDQLQATQEQVAATARQITQQLDDLAAYLTPVVSTWSGTAFESYQARQQEWNTAASDLNAVLASIASTLQEIHNSYRATETGLTRSWG